MVTARRTVHERSSTASSIPYVNCILQDPDTDSTGCMSHQTDTYQLGVTMLQLLTRRHDPGLCAAAEAAVAAANTGDGASFAALLDASAGAWPQEHALMFARLALRCAEPRRAVRPPLADDVLMQLFELVTAGAEPPVAAAGGGPGAAEATEPPSPAARHEPSDDGGRMRESSDSVVGDLFVCPITQEVMADPVVAGGLRRLVLLCSTLQHTATHLTTLQHT
jgi:hypothetical protein